MPAARTRKPEADNPPNKELVDAPRKPEQGSPDRNLPPPLFGILILAGLVVAAAGLRQASAIVGPFFLVLTIVITVHPLRSWLRARNVPSLVASIITLLTVYLLIIVVLGSVIWSLTRLATTLPDYSAQFRNLYEQSVALLESFGISNESLRNAASSVDLGSFAGVARSALSGITSGLSMVALIATLVFFLVFDAAGIEERIATIRRY